MKKNYFLLIIAILISSFTSVLSKMASKFEFLSQEFLLLYGGALLILAVYSIIWQICLEKIPLVKAYALRGLLFVMVCMWSFLFFDETLSPLQIVGVLVIICGVFVSESDAR